MDQGSELKEKRTENPEEEVLSHNHFHHGYFTDKQ